MVSRPSFRFRPSMGFRVLLAAVAAIFFAPGSFAQTSYSFSGTMANADWFQDTNWSPIGVPSTADSVTINNGGSALLADGTGAIAGLSIAGANASSGTLTISNALLNITTNFSMGNANGVASVNVTNSGTLNTTADVFMGHGSIEISGAGSRFIEAGDKNVYLQDSGTISAHDGGAVSLFRDLAVGAGGNSSVLVSSGGTLAASNIYLGQAQSSDVGTLAVTGSGSVVTASKVVFVGSTGTGIVTVGNGGQLSALGGLTFGGAATSSGTMSQTGGTITTNTLTFGQGNSVYHFAGGTLQASSLTKAASGVIYTLDWAGGTVQANGIFTSSLDAVLAPSTVGTFDTNGLAATWSGILSGSGTLHKVGAGVLTLSGSNSFAGGVTLDEGALAVGSNTALGTGTVTVASGTLQASVAGRTVANSIVINSGGTLGLGGSANFTISGTISGDAAVESVGTGVVTLSATNTYTGNTTIKSGELGFTSMASFGTGTATLNGGGVQWAAGNTLDISQAAQFNNTMGANGGTFDTGANAVTLAGSLSGTSSITKAGTGTLTLSGSNAFTGTYKQSGGTLVISNPDAIGNASGLQLTAGAVAFTNNVSGMGIGLSLAGSGTVSGTSALTFSGTLSSNSSVTLTISNTTTTTFGDIALSTAANTLTLSNASGTVQVNGTIRNGGASAAGLAKTGAGLLILSSSNSYSGNTTLTAGTLQIGNARAVGSGTLVFNGGTFQGDGQAYTVANSMSLAANSAITGSSNFTFTGSLALSANATLNILNTGSTTFGNINNNRLLTMNVSGGTTTVAGVISNSGTLVKSGAGTLVLSGSNTYTGVTTGSAGTIVVGNNRAFGTGTFSLAGAAVQGDGTSRTLANALTLAASSTIGGASDLTFTGTLSQTAASTLTIANTGSTSFGAVNLSSGAVSRTLTLDVAKSAVINGVVANGGSVASGLTKINTGTLVLTAANTFTGTTTISGGALQIGNGGATGSLASQSIVNNATLAFNRSGTLTYGGTISGTGSVTQSGSGQVTLGGTSSYSGGTTIAAGTFMVEGSLSGTGTVDVEGGAIGGDGSLGGSLTFNLGAGIAFDPTKTLTINGATVTFAGFSMANVIGLDSTVALGTYTLLDGPAAFDFTNVANFGAANAYDLGNGKFAYFQSGSFEVVVIPEPGSWSLAVIGLGALAYRMRRRAEIP